LISPKRNTTPRSPASIITKEDAKRTAATNVSMAFLISDGEILSLLIMAI
jgi:hypothetical protein